MQFISHDCAMSFTILSVQPHAYICNMQSTVWKNVFTQTLQLELKTKSFLYLPGINSTNMRYFPAVYSINVQDVYGNK